MCWKFGERKKVTCCEMQRILVFHFSSVLSRLPKCIITQSTYKSMNQFFYTLQMENIKFSHEVKLTLLMPHEDRSLNNLQIIIIIIIIIIIKLSPVVYAQVVDRG